MNLLKTFWIFVVITGCVGYIYIRYSSRAFSYFYKEEDARQFQQDSIYVEPYRKQPPLITMFTSWMTFPRRFKVYNCTLRNWPLLQPHVNIILFTNDKIPDKYKQLGWMVLPVRRQVKGHPVLKDMFIEAMQLQPDSKLYGFANGDILFTDSFIKSLQEITNSPLVVNRTYMVVGRRMDTPNVTLKEASSWKNMERAAKRGKLMNEWLGIDYFITSPSYHWKDIPEVQIGQKLYDNWLVRDARKMGHVVIDATSTLLAVHQNAPYPAHHGNMTQNLEYFNESYHTIYQQGVIACCRFHTMYTNHTIKIWRRKHIPGQCTL
ncbi:uncharacterized protein LOC110455139 [Mizuhopecten yessoensis]|nr:uncharacterized protein LOC110455139 [Mizuhopecten yessoensis]